MAPKRNRNAKKKRLADVSVEEFMRDGLDSDEDDSLPSVKKIKKNDEKIETEDEGGDELTTHKRALQNLEHTDPEFFTFLKENDQTLLDFDISDISDDETEGKHDAHKIDDTKLEVASDDSEEEDETEAMKTLSRGHIVVTKAMINQWTNVLKKDPTMEVVQDAVEAFAAAVEQAEGYLRKTDTKFKVASSIIFNNVMRMCIVHIPSALRKMLKIKESENEEEKAVSYLKYKRWPKIKVVTKKYLSHLLKVLAVVSESDIVSVLLKHVYQMVPFITASNRHAKGFLKRLIVIWSSGEESVRVIAMLAIVNITRVLEDVFHEFVLKAMYMAFVRNVKFTSPTTWPTINFMKHCLVEIFALNERLAYQYAFVYIRQLAIHLRNAITVKKKDSIQAVYNWQFIHCLGFWSQLLSSLNQVKTLQPLTYPLVQTIIGTIRLVPTAKYYPLRFHCVQSLTNLSKNTNCFIPILPLLTHVLVTTDFNGKAHRQSWKPMNFTCMLKLSKSQLAENGFKDALLDHLYEYVMDYLSVVSHSIGFPELVLPCVLQMKSFLKSCRVANYCKQIKTLLEKIEENSKYITRERNLLSIKLSDTKAIDAWENMQKQKETPLAAYYVKYRKLRDREVLQNISKKDQVNNVELPTIDRQKLMDKHKEKDKEDIRKLFMDDENDSDTDFFSKKVNSDDECSDLNEISSSEHEDD